MLDPVDESGSGVSDAVAEAREAVFQAHQLLQRIEADDVAKVVLDWWLLTRAMRVVTASASAFSSTAIWYHRAGELSNASVPLHIGSAAAPRPEA